MKKQATLTICFLLTAIQFAPNHVFGEAIPGYNQSAVFADVNAWPLGVEAMDASPGTQVGDGRCSRASLTVLDGWELLVIARQGSAALATLLFRGTASEREAQSDQLAWSLLIAQDEYGDWDEPQLLRWASGLAPIDVRPAGSGFDILLHDFNDGTSRVFSVGIESATEEEPPPPPQPVLQPEDMPEGSGG